jgi:hypothetical protein
VLRLKKPSGLFADRFCRIGRAKSHNPAGIEAYVTTNPIAFLHSLGQKATWRLVLSMSTLPGEFN